MEKEVRARIQRATQEGRQLLEREFTEQLEGVYDIQMNGTVSTAAGFHLAEDAQAQRARIKLVAAVAHHRAQGLSAADAVAALRRECAFTTFNRFVALKMLEAREIVLECVSRGTESKGFKEFLGLAPGLAGSPESAWRLYLESVFDEIGREVRVLFDRRDPASLLWPRRPALDALLGVLNSPDLASVWGEDETIGWVYQYFNGDDERKQMRAESQAPRNSRELAVRNQFFTPRFVVEYLTDNTLGQTWVEMRRGESKLTETCRNLVKRGAAAHAPSEKTRPQDGDSGHTGQRRAYRPFREQKDPRDIKVLDPASGSGHFLLYAFDLLLEMYTEAWQEGEDQPSAATGCTLRGDYPTKEALHLALPGLILRHNLYGVDIDPRAAQIAALALWMRAQRAWNGLAIRRADRPLVTRTNIVIAEPMPGEPDLLDEFCRALPTDVAGVVRKVFEAMTLAGEAGALLRIEDTLRQELQRRFGQAGLFAAQDARRWAEVEPQVYQALRDYSEQAPGGAGYARRLFADDAARGFAFVDLCRQRYDVVLMNPPFGDATPATKDAVGHLYTLGINDIAAMFVDVGARLGCEHGKLGVICNRTVFAVQAFAGWRNQLLTERTLETYADLGHGVLDAMVETAMFTISTSPGRATGGVAIKAGFLSLLESRSKPELLDTILADQNGRILWRDASVFRKITGTPLSYWVPDSLLSFAGDEKSFLQCGGLICQGTATADDFRFYRLRWEVEERLILVDPVAIDPRFRRHSWSPVAKGGEYALWWDDIHLVQYWREDGHELRNFVDPSGKQRSFPKNLDKSFRRGCTYPYRTTSGFAMRLLPGGISFSVGGWAVFAPEGATCETVLAVYNSRVARYFMEILLGQGDSSSSGTAARNHVAAAVGGIPWPKHAMYADTDRWVLRLIDLAANDPFDETGAYFNPQRLLLPEAESFDALCSALWGGMCDKWREVAQLTSLLDQSVAAAYSLDADDLAVISDAEGPALHAYPSREVDIDGVAELMRSGTEALTATAQAACQSKRYVVKKAYFVDRKVDLICHILRVSPESVLAAACAAGPAACGASTEMARAILHALAGVAFGEYVLGSSISSSPAEDSVLPNPASRPQCRVDMLVDDPGAVMDIASCIERAAERVWHERAANILAEALGAGRTLRQWLRADFFEEHVQRYSKSRRKAPIYWRLGSPSGSYSVWVHLHRFSKDTLHRVLTDHVAPKLRYEENRLHGLKIEAGSSPAPSQRRTLADQEAFVEELQGLRDEVARLSPLWAPDLDDGVLLNAAPLHRLFGHTRSWQKECETAWKSLGDADYEWSHIAMRLWPERIVRNCARDRTLAIAHGLESVFWVEGGTGKSSPRSVPAEDIDRLIADRRSVSVQAALLSLERAGITTGTARPGRPARGVASSPVPRTAGGRQLTLPAPSVAPDGPVLDTLRAAFHQFPDPASRADLLAASGLDEASWKPAIDALVARGEVERTGQARGTRYSLVHRPAPLS